MTLIGCSSKLEPIEKKVKPKGVLAEPVWFKVPERFSSRTNLGNIDTHPFFDLTAFKTKESFDLSYYLVTPKRSPYHYKFDLVSGKKWRRHSYCSQKDIWESYENTITTANFAQGIIPRLLNRTGSPQKIWVFGRKSHFFSSQVGDRSQSQRARIVGGVILEYCNDYPCKAGRGWESQLILIGVNKFDEKYKDVKTLADLKKVDDWAYTVAFAKNGYGRSIRGPVAEPAYRLISEVNAERAVNFVYRDGHEFNFDEINSIRKNCFYLYDYIWRAQKKVRRKMKEAKDNFVDLDKEIARRAKKIRELRRFQLSRVFNDTLELDLRVDEEKEDEKYVDFGKFYSFLMNNYGERLRTCFRYVRAGNIQDNKDRLWFFAFLKNWVNLENLNYFYVCQARSWVKNPKLDANTRRYSSKDLLRCNSREIDIGMSGSVSTMVGLKNSTHEHYDFIEYDNGPGGSHQKMYNWAYSTGKVLGCEAKEEWKRTIFPQDVTWERFQDQNIDKLELIR